MSVYELGRKREILNIFYRKSLNADCKQLFLFCNVTIYSEEKIFFLTYA